MSEQSLNKIIDEAALSKEHAELLKACNAFIEATDSIHLILSGLAHCLAMSACRINKPESFIREIADQAIKSHSFASSMALAVCGDENVH